MDLHYNQEVVQNFWMETQTSTSTFALNMTGILLIHFTSTQRTISSIYSSFRTNIYLPGCISIMEDLWVVMCCIEAIQSEEKACNNDNPTPHDKSVNKCCATVRIHHKQGDEWNQVLLPKCRFKLAFNCHIQPETIAFLCLLRDLSNPGSWNVLS